MYERVLQRRWRKRNGVGGTALVLPMPSNLARKYFSSLTGFCEACRVEGSKFPKSRLRKPQPLQEMGFSLRPTLGAKASVQVTCLQGPRLQGNRFVALFVASWTGFRQIGSFTSSCLAWTVAC